mgnify:CR=1 FL=1
MMECESDLATHECLDGSVRHLVEVGGAVAVAVAEVDCHVDRGHRRLLASDEPREAVVVGDHEADFGVGWEHLGRCELQRGGAGGACSVLSRLALASRLSEECYRVDVGEHRHHAVHDAAQCDVGLQPVALHPPYRVDARK